MTVKRNSLKTFLCSCGIAVLVIVSYFLFRPLPAATLNNCATHTGSVLQVQQGQSGDILIRLKDDKNYYYINRGKESGLTVSQLESKLINQPVELLTIISPNPLDGLAIGKHIARVKFEDSIIYTEL